MKSLIIGFVLILTTAQASANTQITNALACFNYGYNQGVLYNQAGIFDQADKALSNEHVLYIDQKFRAVENTTADVFCSQSGSVAKICKDLGDMKSQRKSQIKRIMLALRFGGNRSSHALHDFRSLSAEVDRLHNECYQRASNDSRLK